MEKLIKMSVEFCYLDPTEAVSGLRGWSGTGESHISSRGILPSLSRSPGVDWLLGRAAVEKIELLENSDRYSNKTRYRGSIKDKCDSRRVRQPLSLSQVE